MLTAPNPFRHDGREVHLLREIVRAYQALMAGFSRGVGMPASRFMLVRLLANAPDDGVGTMELSRQLGVNAAAVTRQVKELEADGLVRRRADGRDGRRSNFTLSAKGARVFADIHERTHELERALSSAIPPAEMAAAADVLARLRAFVEGRR